MSNQKFEERTVGQEAKGNMSTADVVDIMDCMDQKIDRLEADVKMMSETLAVMSRSYGAYGTPYQPNLFHNSMLNQMTQANPWRQNQPGAYPPPGYAVAFDDWGNPVNIPVNPQQYPMHAAQPGFDPRVPNQGGYVAPHIADFRQNPPHHQPQITPMELPLTEKVSTTPSVEFLHDAIGSPAVLLHQIVWEGQMAVWGKIEKSDVKTVLEDVGYCIEKLYPHTTYSAVNDTVTISSEDLILTFSALTATKIWGKAWDTRGLALDPAIGNFMRILNGIRIHNRKNSRGAGSIPSDLESVICNNFAKLYDDCAKHNEGFASYDDDVMWKVLYNTLGGLTSPDEQKFDSLLEKSKYYVESLDTNTGLLKITDGDKVVSGFLPIAKSNMVKPTPGIKANIIIGNLLCAMTSINEVK